MKEIVMLVCILFSVLNADISNNKVKGQAVYEQAEKLLQTDGDGKEMRKLYKQGCELNHADSCVKYSMFLLDTRDYFNPESIYLQKACKLKDAKACAMISGYFLIAKKNKEAVYYAEKACSYGHSNSCTMLDRMSNNHSYSKYFSKKNKDYIQTAEQNMIKYCKSGNGEECKKVGDIYNPEIKGNGNKKQSFIAIDYYKKGCKLENKASCGSLADLYYSGMYSRVKKPVILELYEKGCQAYGLTDHYCQKTGKMYYYGFGTKVNYGKAMKYLKKNCDMDSLADESCFLVGSMYKDGKGVSQNIIYAAKYFKKSCEAEKIIQSQVKKPFEHNGCNAYQETRRH